MLLTKFAADLETGPDWGYAIFQRGAEPMIGAIGVHARIGPRALEIGYWIDGRLTRQGFATEAAGAVTRMALTLPDVDRVEIRCDPANVDKLRDAALGVLREVQKNGISAEYLDKVKEQLRRARETDAKENWWWASELRNAYWYGEDFTGATDMEPILARATSANIKAAAKRFFDEKNLVIGVLRPKQ